MTRPAPLLVLIPMLLCTIAPGFLAGQAPVAPGDTIRIRPDGYWSVGTVVSVTDSIVSDWICFGPEVAAFGGAALGAAAGAVIGGVVGGLSRQFVWHPVTAATVTPVATMGGPGLAVRGTIPLR